MSNEEKVKLEQVRQELNDVPNNGTRPQATGGSSSSSTTFGKRSEDRGCRNGEITRSAQSQGSSKGKNATKKEKLRNMHLEMPGAAPRPPQTKVQSSPSSWPQNGYISVQELLFQQGAVYNPSTNYLENMSCLPQYQYMQSGFVNRIQAQKPSVTGPGSLPNTPLSNMNCMLQALSTPNSPQSIDPGSPRYMQNVMQHPLLNQSYSRYNNLQYRQEQRSPKNTDAKNKKGKTKNQDDREFEPYFTVEMVEAGLKQNTLIEGPIRINPKQFQHAYISSIDRSEQDIFIDGVRNRNRALEGDVVVVQLLQQNEENTEENKQRRGKVVFIKEKVHTRTCIGHLKLMPDKNRMKALFVPRDHRIPRLNIPFTSWPNNFYQDEKKYENTLFLASIENWEDTRFAYGKITCSIGQSGDMLTETKAILAQTNLDVTPFGPEVRDLYPRLDYVIPETEIQRREDCRKLCIFSVDPANCRDIDDAVSCIKLENGNYEIGVHISDVTHFLTENTILDGKVAEKATTVYLVEKAYHMLPDDLCMLCSLFPGVDKLAFSVFWEITHDAKVLSHRFSKTVIHSCCQLSYDQVQHVLDNDDDAEASFPEVYNGYSYKDVVEPIKIIGNMASILRNTRFNNGALRIDQPKIYFCLDPATGLPDKYSIYVSQPCHQLIEEFMLLANMTVAQKIYDSYPNLAFLRCHPPPSTFMMQQLEKSLKPMGIDLDITSAGNLYQSILPYIGPENQDSGKAMVLNMLCAKPMARAKYFCAAGCHDNDFHHYALNVPLYTHFTSPIRRYADVMVHRLLAASLNYSEAPRWDKTKVQKIALQCNKQKYNSKRASELSAELYTLKYIQINSPVITEAVVVDIRDKYLDVIITSMGLNRKIFFNSDFPGEHKCIKNDAGMRLSKMELLWKAKDKSPAIKQVIEVFSIVKVELVKVDDMIKIETKLVKPV